MISGWELYPQTPAFGIYYQWKPILDLTLKMADNINNFILEALKT